MTGCEFAAMNKNVVGVTPYSCSSCDNNNNNNNNNNRFTAFVQDYPGEPVPEETLTHSPS